MEAVLPENARTYFLERDSAAFRSLLAKVLKLGTMEMTETWREGESTFVRLVTRPDFGSWVPKSVQGQANGKSIEFHDVLEYRPELIEREPFQINVKTESPFLGNKLDVQLKLIIEAVDENTCRQVLAGSIKVNMFGVGRIVEGIVKDSLQNTYKYVAGPAGRQTCAFYDPTECSLEVDVQECPWPPSLPSLSYLEPTPDIPCPTGTSRPSPPCLFPLAPGTSFFLLFPRPTHPLYPSSTHCPSFTHAPAGSSLTLFCLFSSPPPILPTSQPSSCP